MFLGEIFSIQIVENLQYKTFKVENVRKVFGTA